MAAARKDERVAQTLAGKVTSVNLFQHPESHPYVLDLVLLQKYGPEWMEWEVETLLLRITQDFAARSVSDLNLEKLQAIKTLHYVDFFWKEWETFSAVTMALNSMFADFAVMQVPKPSECAVAVDIANRIRDDVPFSEEVKTYLATVHVFYSVLCPVEPLEFVEVDTSPYPFDAERVKRDWPDVRRTGKVNVTDPETAQLERMLEVHQAVRRQQERLAEQLALFRHG